MYLSKSKQFLVLTILPLLLINISTSSAQLIEGCDQRIWDAMEAKARAKIAYDVGITEEIIKQPDSVLALTCFDDAARISAQQGGAIFSGDFWSGELSNVIQSVMSNMIQNFNDDQTLGWEYLTYDGTYNFSTSFSCDLMDDLWTDIIDAGIDDEAPFITANELVNNSPVGAGTILSNNLTAENGSAGGGLFDYRARTVTNPLPSPAIPSFSSANTLCDVITTIDTSATCP